MPITTSYDYISLALLSAIFVGLPMNWALRDSALRQKRLAFVIGMWTLPFLAIPGRGGPLWLVMILLHPALLHLVGAAPRREVPRRTTLRRRLLGKDPRSRIRLILVSLIILIIGLLIFAGTAASDGEIMALEQLKYVLVLPGIVLALLGMGLGMCFLLFHPILAFVVGYVLPAGLLCAPWVLYKGVSGRRRTLTWCWLILSPLALHRSAQVGFHYALVASPVFPGTSIGEKDLDYLSEDIYADHTTVFVVRKDSFFTTLGSDFFDVFYFWGDYLLTDLSREHHSGLIGPIENHRATLDCIPR